MALRDVKQYYLNMLSQYVEIKDDLADFEQALKDGHITEDQLEVAKADVAAAKNNVDRIAYMLFLFNLPKRKDKRAKYLEANTNIAKLFSERGADEKAVFDESTDLIKHLRDELKKLKELEANKK